MIDNAKEVFNKIESLSIGEMKFWLNTLETVDLVNIDNWIREILDKRGMLQK